MDVAAMADRISSAVSAVADPPAAAAEPTVTTTPDPTPTPEPAAAPEPSAAGEPAAFDFEDEPEELRFDEPEPEPEPVAAAAQPMDEDAKDAADIAAVLKAGGFPKQLENALMKTNRGRHILATYKAERILREAPNFDANGQNIGGLGFMPTPEQIKDFHQGASDWQAATHEFAANPGSWAVNWFGPDQQGQFRDGTAAVLQNIPQVLDQAYQHAVQTGNQQLREQAVAHYSAVFKPMLSSYLDGLYSRANSIQDPAQREQFINAARAIEHDVFGKFRADDQLTAQPKADPLAQREAELQERESRLNAWQSRQMTESQKAAENQIFSNIDQNLTADVTKALSSVKAGMTERAFRAAVNDFKREIQEAVRQNRLGWRDFNFSLSAARTNRGADAHEVPVQTYRQIARQAIQARYRNVLKELADGSVRQNQATHDTAAAAAAHRAPNANGGQAPPQSVIPTSAVQRRPGEDRAEYFQRRIAAGLGARPN